MKTIRVCHLYGNLLNTYGDYGNLLYLKYLANIKGYTMDIEVISLDEVFNPEQYDFVFIGGGQDYEQRIIARDIQTKVKALQTYIESDKVLLAICGGYQLLGHYYELSDGTRITCAGVLPHYTTNQDNNRFIGEVLINKDGESYAGFENHQGRTYLGEGEVPLGIVSSGNGNNGEDKTEGAIYHNAYCSYFHGPLLVRNEQLANKLLNQMIKSLEINHPYTNTTSGDTSR